MSVLQVIDQAFRTTTEEQDDTILWLVQCMQSAGAKLTVLLSGHGVYYATLKKRQPSVSFGDWQQTQSAELPKDISNLISKGVPVYVVEEDLAERGLNSLPLTTGVITIPRNQLAALYEDAEKVWHW